MLAQNLFPKGIARSDIMKMRSFAVIRVDDVRLFSYVGTGRGGWVHLEGEKAWPCLGQVRQPLTVGL